MVRIVAEDAIKFETSLLATARALLAAKVEATMEDFVARGDVTAEDAAAWQRHGDVCEGIVKYSRSKRERDDAIERELARNAKMIDRVAPVRAAERKRVAAAQKAWLDWFYGLPREHSTIVRRAKLTNEFL